MISINTYVTLSYCQLYTLPGLFFLVSGGLVSIAEEEGGPPSLLLLFDWVGVSCILLTVAPFTPAKGKGEFH